MPSVIAHRDVLQSFGIDTKVSKFWTLLLDRWIILKQLTIFECDYVIQTNEYKSQQVISIGQKIREEKVAA